MDFSLDKASRPRVVCLLVPEGADEKTIGERWSSQSIIGLEQYRLIRQHSGLANLVLYDAAVSYGDDDILLVMLCLPVASEAILEKFKKIVYYFDDMHSGKARRPEYAPKFERVAAYISPLRAVADEMNGKKVKPSFHLPWSMNDPDFAIVKTKKPSVFIDMDEREFTAFSIANGFELAALCLELGMQVYVWDRFREQSPEKISNSLSYISRMAPREFKMFLSSQWFYASGIRGSYEYCVLESAMMGCGLIAIRAAVKEEHLIRRCCLDFHGQGEFSRLLVDEILSFDPQGIIDDAHRLYPQNASIALPGIMEQAFQIA